MQAKKKYIMIVSLVVFFLFFINKICKILLFSSHTHFVECIIDLKIKDAKFYLACNKKIKTESE